MSIRYSGIERMHLEQTPEVLAQKAREIVAYAGYTEKPTDRAFGFDYDTNLISAVDKQKTANWDEVLNARPNVLYFSRFARSYGLSGRPACPRHGTGRSSSADVIGNGEREARPKGQTDLLPGDASAEGHYSLFSNAS